MTSFSKPNERGKKRTNKSQRNIISSSSPPFLSLFEKKPLFNKCKTSAAEMIELLIYFSRPKMIRILCFISVSIENMFLLFGRRSSGNEATKRQNNSSLSTAKSIVDWISIATKFINISASWYNDINY